MESKITANQFNEVYTNLTFLGCIKCSMRALKIIKFIYLIDQIGLIFEIFKGFVFNILVLDRPQDLIWSGIAVVLLVVNIIYLVCLIKFCQINSTEFLKQPFTIKHVLKFAQYWYCIFGVYIFLLIVGNILILSILLGVLANGDNNRDDQRKITATLITSGFSIFIWLLYFNQRFSFVRSIRAIGDAIEINQMDIDYSIQDSDASNKSSINIQSIPKSEKSVEKDIIKNDHETQKIKPLSKTLTGSKSQPPIIEINEEGMSSNMRRELDEIKIEVLSKNKVTHDSSKEKESFQNTSNITKQPNDSFNYTVQNNSFISNPNEDSMLNQLNKQEERPNVNIYTTPMDHKYLGSSSDC